MDNLIDDHPKLSVFFIMGYKEIRLGLTFGATTYREWIFIATNLLAVLVNFIDAGRNVE